MILTCQTPLFILIVFAKVVYELIKDVDNHLVNLYGIAIVESLVHKVGWFESFDKHKELTLTAYLS